MNQTVRPPSSTCHPDRPDSPHSWSQWCTWLILLGVAAPALAIDWPAYKHDAQRSSVSGESLTFPLRLAWQYEAPQPPSPAWPDVFRLENRTDFDYAAQPVVAQGIVCFGSSSDDTVRALDAKTGKEKWHFMTGGPVRFAPQLDAGKAFFASDDGFVYCVEAGTGKLVWKFQAAPRDERMVGNHRLISRWPVRTGVLVADGVVYCVAGMWNMEGVFVHALQAGTGKALWCNDTLGLSSVTIVDFPESADPSKETVGGHNGEFAANGATGANPQGNLLLWENTLIIPNGNSGPTVLDRRTGNLAPKGGGGGAPVTIDRDNVYSFARHHEDILSMNPVSLSTGSASRGWGKGAIPQVRITPPKLGQIHDHSKVSAVVHDGKLYARQAYGLALIGETLVVGENGAVAAQDPDTERVLWRAGITGEARGIAVADGRLYVGTSSGAVYCFETPAKGAETVAAVKASAAGPRAAAPPANARMIEQLRLTGMDRGFALVLGDADGKFSASLAASTELSIVIAMTDETAASALRERLLAQTTYYGERVQVQTVKRLDQLPFAQFFANAVIVAGSTPGISAKELYRVLHPCGGVLLTPGLKPAEADALVKNSGATDAEIRQSPTDRFIVRGKLPGALDWDTVARTGVRVDQRIKWPLRPLWFGGPGTLQVQGVHGGGAPVVANGRYIVKGEQSLTAVDAYNGAILWSRPLPLSAPDYCTVDGVIYPVADSTKFGGEGLTRTTFRAQYQANDDFVYVQLGTGYFQPRGDDLSNALGQAPQSTSSGEGNIQLDARTGEQLKLSAPFTTHDPISLKAAQKWSIEVNPRRSGTVGLQSTERGLLLTLDTKDTLVTKLDAWHLFFDFRPPEKRYGLYDRGTFEVRIAMAQDRDVPATWTPGSGTAHPAIEVNGTRDPAGTTTTVLVPWAEIQKLVGARPSSFGFAATLDSHDGGREEPITRRHLFCDWTASGLNNGWACLVLDAAATADAGKRPSILVEAFKGTAALSGNGDVVGPEREAPRIHPLTGDLEPKMFRVGGCGGLSSSGVLRSGSQSIYDFDDDSGMRPLGGVKARCSTPQIAALGLLIYSEESGHCECPFPVRTTLVMAPAERRLNEDWAFFFARPADTYLRQAAINFGAPGDRRDEGGTLWLGYPRLPGDKSMAFPLPAGKQRSVGANGVWLRIMSAELQLPVEVESFESAAAYTPGEDLKAVTNWQSSWSPGRNGKDMGPYRVNADRVEIHGTDRPWIYASGYKGIRKATVKLNFLQPVVAAKIEKAPALNGKLDGPEWQNATKGKLPFTKTETFVCHDDANLYIAARRPSVQGRLGKTVPWAKATSGEDANVWDDDSFEVFLSDDHSGAVVHLGVSASGARYDALADGATDKPEDRKWNADWKSHVAADDAGLVIQFAIPWKTIEAAGLKKDRLSVNLQMNQKDTSGESPRSPGKPWNPKDTGTSGEALSYLGITGRSHCVNFAPLGLDSPPKIEPRHFTVRLHFAEPDDIKPGQRVFDVKLQDKTVLKGFDVVKEAGGVRTALVKEFKNVAATETMVLEFVAPGKEPTSSSASILSAVEVFDENFKPAPKPL